MTNHVVFSGGLDSTVTLATVLYQYGNATALSFKYGQTHEKELDHAQAVVARLGVPLHVIDLTGLMHGSALLGDTAIPDGDYNANNMADTVVNGRNLLFASVAIAAAEPGDTIHFGVHAGDHHIYPDCRPEFWTHVEAAAAAYDVTVETPFLSSTKAEIVDAGAAVDAPMDLSWSCYRGGDRQCGTCGTCRERQEAFRLAGVPDGTRYAQ